MNTPSGSNFSFHVQPEPKARQSFADHESSLWRAVITQALMDAASRSRKPEAIRNRQEALEWLLGLTADFENVCDNAGMDPDYVRTQARHALKRVFIWRLPAGQGWRTKGRATTATTNAPTKH